jgi:thymidine kinase
VQRKRDAHVDGDSHYAVEDSVHAWSATDHCRRRYESSLIGRLVLDEMGFVASQHLDSVRDKFHLHDFSHIGEKLLSNFFKQPFGALSKLLLMLADIQGFI